MHWKNDCPHFQMFTEELVQECYLDALVGETFSSALSDSATKTVCGIEWLKENNSAYQKRIERQL